MCIPCLADKIPMKCQLTVSYVLHFWATFVLSHLWSLKYSLFDNHICFWQLTMKFFTVIYKQFTCGGHISSFRYITTYGFLVWHFFLIYVNIFWNCKHIVYIQNTNAHKMLNWQPQILYTSKPYLFLHIYNPFSITFLSHICSFISTIPLVFHVWKSYLCFAYAYDIFTVIHKHFTIGSHISFSLFYANNFWNCK